METREHTQKQRPKPHPGSGASGNQNARPRSNPNRRPLTPEERQRQRQLRMRKRRQQQICSLTLMALLLILIIVILVWAFKKDAPKPPDNSVLPTESSSQIENSTDPEEPLPNASETESSSQPELSQEPVKTKLHFALPDASVTEGTDAARIEFSHGPASNNTVHHLVKKQQEEMLSKYDAYAVDLEIPESEKVLYLTFDCGYEYEGRTEACLDILKEKNVPAAFYLVGDFAEMEPELTQRMIDEGHIVGNHSMGHEDLTQMDDASVMKAIQDFDTYMKENFDYNATTFRFPSGTFSERTLAMVHSFGYKTYFWSVAYADWERDQGIGTAAAMELLKDGIHPGAIILLHCVSADEPAVLEAFIDHARSEGYTFKLVED